MRNANRDLWLGVFVVALSLLFLFVLIPYGVEAPEDVEVLALDPRFWPNIIMVAMGIVGLSICVGVWLQRRNATSAEPTEPFDKIRAIKTLTALAGLFAYYFFLETAGFIIASSIAILGFMLLAGERRYVRMLLIAVLLPLGLYLFFTKMANVYLPLGWLEGLR